MKKLLGICTLMILSLFAVGCTKSIDLTEEENYMVAEYAAELLIKYGTKIDLKYYYDGEDTTEELTTTEVVTEETTTEGPTTTEESVTEAATTEVTTELVDNTTEEPEAGDGSNNQTTPIIGIENISGVEANVDKNFNIGEFLGEKNLSVKYSYYMLLDRYPSYDQDGVYIEIEAPKGYKLLVVKFNVENTVNEPHEVDLYNKDVVYRIIVDKSKAARQMLTVLMDDLYTYQKTMEPSMFEENVLLFQISDDIAQNMSDLKLQIKYEDKEAVMQLD